MISHMRSVVHHRPESHILTSKKTAPSARNSKPVSGYKGWNTFSLATCFREAEHHSHEPSSHCSRSRTSQATETIHVHIVGSTTKLTLVSASHETCTDFPIDAACCATTSCSGTFLRPSPPVRSDQVVGWTSAV